MKKSNALEAIEKIAHGNSLTKKRILEIFANQASKDLTDIDSCVLMQDWIELRKIIHKFHASFLYFDMKEPIVIIEKLMDTAGVDITATKEQINELKMICSDLINEFKNELIK